MDNKEVVTRLAKPVKKGLLHLIFSRFFVVAVLLLLQVAILLGVFRWVLDYVPQLAAVQSAFAFIMIVWLFNSDMDSSAKLTWMFIISIAPLPGAAFRRLDKAAGLLQLPYLLWVTFAGYLNLMAWLLNR